MLVVNSQIIILIVVVSLFFVPNSAFANGINSMMDPTSFMIYVGFVFGVLIASGFVLYYFIRKILKKILGKEKLERKSGAVNTINLLSVVLVISFLIGYAFMDLFTYM